MHRWPDNVDHPGQITLLRELLRHFADREILFAVHEELDRRLVESLGIPRDVVLDSPNPADYIRLYSDPDNVVLAMRLHAGMLAVAGGVPAVFVAHDTRTYSFCQMMSLEYVDLFSPRCAADCAERLDHLLDGNVTCFAGLNDRFQPLLSAMERFLANNNLPSSRPLPACDCKVTKNRA